LVHGQEGEVFLMRTYLVLSCLVGATALTLAVGPTGSAVGPERANAETNACRVPLNLDRRTVYRFTNGQQTLGFGQVVVTATKADRHKYCIRVGFGGRTPLNAWGESSYLRRDGKWVYEGSKGSSTTRTGGYTLSPRIRDKTRTDYGFSITRNGRVYSTITIRRYNL